MREIKFRAFGKNSKAFLTSGDKEVGLTLKEIQNIYDIDGWVFSQYTGLKDKNGRDIYEGDIFHIGEETNYGHILYIVEWHDTGLKARQYNNKSYIGLEYWQSDIKVIGNVFENPELLDGKI